MNKEEEEEEYLLLIKPKKEFSFGFKELFSYSELLYFFTLREIKVKYKQTVLGVLWVLLQPLFMTFVFTTFLGKAIANSTELSLTYPMFVLSGMVIWNFFSSGLTSSANSMVSNANIIKKIYFPRLIIPISSILSAGVDFIINVSLLILFSFIFSSKLIALNLMLIPVAFILISFATFGLGLFLSAMNIKYRDVRYILPFFIQGLLFISPIMFPISITNNLYLQKLLQLNPIAGSLELIRGIFYNYTINWETVILSTITAIVLFIIGILTFRKTESFFADIA